MKRFIKNNIKLIIGIIIGAAISGTSVYAATILFYSNQVGYDNTSSGMSATNVQDALDELYTLANQPKGKNNIVYFELGDPTTSSTTDYTTLYSEVFVALNGGQKSVCIIRNSRLHCFDSNNEAIEKDHIQQVFSDASCSVLPSGMDCNATDFSCDVESDGSVACDDHSDFMTCYVNSDGSADCLGS